MKRTSTRKARPPVQPGGASAARQRFATRLRAARQAAGLSQEDLAELAGVHRTYVGSVERGERNVSIDNMERLALGVGRSLAELLAETGGDE